MRKAQLRSGEGATLHPLLFGLFPILSLLGHNIIEVAPADSLRAILSAVLVLGLLWLLTRAITRWSWSRVGLVVSLFALLFFSYGHVYALVEGASLLGLRFGRHLFLVPFWLAIFLAGIRGIARIGDPATLTRTLNFIGVALLVFPLFQIGSHEYTTLRSRARSQAPAPGQTDGAPQPDIYYIILDAYTRDDTLLEVFGYDNTPFLEALEERGFYIPQCTRSNYVRTYLSISSSLNMDYVQAFAPYHGPGELTAMIKDSAVRRYLTARGYSIVAFDPGYFRTRWPDADLWLRYENRSGGLRTINEYEAQLVETTALSFLLDANLVLGGSPLGFIYETTRVEKYNRVEFIFDTLEDMPEVPGPKFVWVHVPAPHGPYVFTAKGSISWAPEDTPTGYRDQVVYLNQRVLDAVDAILARSEVPPIIVIQGDHGSELTLNDARRLNVLNAYLVPAESRARLYPTITPVNTFRLIFDEAFGEDFGLLPDVSYYSPPGSDYNFALAQDSRPGCAAQEAEQ